MTQAIHCWCGQGDLAQYSPAYKVCLRCQTLVSALPESHSASIVRDDQQDFYGRQYWYEHQERELGFANIESRARTDLTDRCQHWLGALLQYKLPPARVLEIGSAHGGFVAILRTAGFDATGLELSPSIVEFSRRTFDVPMLIGPIEQQRLGPGTLDVIAMMDVLEHLPDPLGTVQCCARLLKPDGVLMVQTPEFPPGLSQEQLTASQSSFPAMLLPREHIHLFSEQSARELFGRAGLGHVVKETAMFPGHDMFLFASPSPISRLTEAQTEQALLCSPRGRMTLLMLDICRHNKLLESTIAEIEADREVRLRNMQILTAEVQKLNTRLSEVEADREVRLDHINTLTANYTAVLENREELLKQVETLVSRQIESQKIVKSQVIGTPK